MYRNILLATDGSENSFRALKHALYLTKINPEAHLIILSVLDGTASKSDVLRYLNDHLAEEKRLDKTSSMDKKELQVNKDYEIKIIRGEAAPSIIAFANEHNIDIIILGGRGLSMFQEFMLGSVSHKVTERASCPVMIVK